MTASDLSAAAAEQRLRHVRWLATNMVAPEAAVCTTLALSRMATISVSEVDNVPKFGMTLNHIHFNTL
jgi:hypothetical protein